MADHNQERNYRKTGKGLIRTFLCLVLLNTAKIDMTANAVEVTPEVTLAAKKTKAPTAKAVSA